MAGDAFETEMLEALPKLRRWASQLTRSADQGEDLTQETLIKALRYKDSYIIGSNMVAWLRFIAKATFISEKRRAWRSVQWDDDFAKTLKINADAHHALELKEVLQAMKFLPRDYAEAVMMIAEGMSYEEAAEELGCAVGSVKSRVSRGREALERLFSA